MAEPVHPRSTSTITGSFVFVDLAGYTAASWMHGDDTAARLAIQLLDLAIERCGPADEVVKSIGDAVMCRTPDPTSALAFVRRLWTTADTLTNFPQLRGAVHDGTATRYRGDYFGTDVIITARLAALAAADEILSSSRLVAAARESDWSVERLGPRHLRNIGAPVDVCRLSLHDRVTNPVDPICHMRVDPSKALRLISPSGDTLYFCSSICLDAYEPQSQASLAPS